MASTSKSKSNSIPRLGNRGTTSFSSDRKARTLTTKTAKSSGIEVTTADSCGNANPTREAERLNNILGNLRIRFKCCTFTFKEEHFAAIKTGKEKSRWKKWKANSKNTLKRLGEAIGVEESEFKSCIFVPKSEEDQVQEYVRKNFTDTRITFENCRFVKRGSTVFEKVAQRLRGVFGIIFELTYPAIYQSSSVEVEEYTFRLKDINVITTYVQERIVEKF